MYSKPPSLVLGFHGCEKTTFDSVINGRSELHPSVNDYDWLGSGIYFWEQNYARAYQWAQDSCKRKGNGEPAVIGAVIDLGYCLNLTDARYIDLLRKEYGFLKLDLEMMGLEMPCNAGKTEDKLLRRLDCAVVEHLHARMKLEQAKHKEPSGISVAPFDSARGLFSEGGVIYPGAGFKAKTHVQICVRNPNCIKGYFVPREANSEWRIPWDVLMICTYQTLAIVTGKAAFMCFFLLWLVCYIAAPLFKANAAPWFSGGGILAKTAHFLNESMLGRVRLCPREPPKGGFRV